MDIERTEELPSSRGSSSEKRKRLEEVSHSATAEEGPSTKKSRKASTNVGSAAGGKSKRGAKQTTALNVKEATGVKRGANQNTGLTTKRAASGSNLNTGAEASKKDGEDVAEEEQVAVMPTVPQDAPIYVKNAVGLCLWVEGDRLWQKVVDGWWRFDQATGFAPSSKVLSRLPAAGRPKEVGTWISYARSSTFRPEVTLPRFAEEFAEWWRSMQPEGRKALDDRFISLSKPARTDWGELKISGPNGIVSVVVALAWWRKAVYDLPLENASRTGRSGQKREAELRKLNEAFEEVIYVFGKLI